LLGIDSIGSSIASATIYAVGNGGMVLTWNGTGFDFDPLVYELDPDSGQVIYRRVPIDLETVGISPSGGTVLIGGQYDINMHHAAYFGRMLKLDATGWTSPKSNSSKNIVSMTMFSDTAGLVLGSTAQKDVSSGIGSRTHGCSGYSDDDVESSSFDLANGPASVVLRFDTN
jgi:hypothetical protein